MDLVEIRKKAKSRKRKGKEQESSEHKRKETTASRDLAPKEEPSAGSGKMAETDQEKHQVEESKSTAVKKNQDVLEGSDQESGDLSSLKSVLMSQQETDEEEGEEEHLQLLVFQLGREEYALNIMDIKEIIRPKEVTEVPRAPEYILGILSLRGTIIPVMDVKKRLGLAVKETDGNSRIVVVKWHEHLFGLFVDAVLQVTHLPLAQIEPPPEILGGVEGEFLRGVGKLDERLIILLNLSRILDFDELETSGSDKLVLESGS